MYRSPAKYFLYMLFHESMRHRNTYNNASAILSESHCTKLNQSSALSRVCLSCLYVNY